MPNETTLWNLTASIVDSDPVLRTFTATEWDCLNDDGKEWLCAIVREAMLRAGVALVPVVPIKLVDRPRRSEDPRLARANDNSLAPPPGGKIRSGEDGPRGDVSGSLPVPEASPHPDDGGANG